jgi:hypothetical protein
MSDKQESVPIVANTLTSEKWKLITSLLGMQAGKQLPKIVKCFVVDAIE